MTYFYKLIAIVFILLPSFNVNASAESNMPPNAYKIVIDRYFNYNPSNDTEVVDGEDARPYGGDFEGLIKHIDHVKEMGFNTIWLSPVFEHTETDYLGYDVVSYSDIESSFGGPNGFRELIKTIHELNMEVIVDIPTTYTDEFNSQVTGEFNDIETDYYNQFGGTIIDLTNEDNAEIYKSMMEDFVNSYEVDGLSMYIHQNNLDAKKLFPSNIDTYGITTVEGIQANNFDYIALEETRNHLKDSFSYFEQPIMEYPNSNELLLVDHFFSERFVNDVVEQKAFPITRIKQLSNYMFIYPGAKSILYGTEVAYNGDQMPDIHPQLNFWTQTELMDTFKEKNEILSQYSNLYNADLETVYKDDGIYVTRFLTNDIDYVLYINDSAETTNIEVPIKDNDSGKMLNGLMRGENVRLNDGVFNMILERENTELYAVIKERGVDLSYLIAAVIIFAGFGVFIYFVAKKQRPYKNPNDN